MLLWPIAQNVMPNGGWNYTEPSTGVKFNSMALPVILDQIKKHRDGMKILCPHNWRDILMDEICRQGGYNCEPNPRAEGYESPLMIEGRARWNELHAYSLTVPENFTQADKDAMQVWFSAWVTRCPNFSGCRCREGLVLALANRPPNYSSRDAFFAFCVELHSDISESIGKRRWRVSGPLEASPA